MSRRFSIYRRACGLAGWAGVLMIGLYPAVSAATPIGYEPADFTVRGVSSAGQQIESLGDADALLSGQIASNRDVTNDDSTVNFVDPGYSHDGHYVKHNEKFPTNTRRNDNNFAIQADGLISIPAAGDYTFGANSDDGIRVTIDGQTLINGIQHQPHDTLQVMHFDAAGVYDFDLTYFEHKGLAELEFFAAAGDFTKFHAPGADWALVGDTNNGGLEMVKATSSAAVGSERSVGDENPPSVGNDQAPIPVPEPAAACLFLTAGAAMLTRRPR